jgi:CrcB protein
MKNYLYVFAGGAAGGLLRVMAVRSEDLFIIGGMDCTILLINLLGAFLLGMFLSGTARFATMNPGFRLAVAVGFFGSFTTFSTLAMEAAGLLAAGNIPGLILYILTSCIAGLGAAALGYGAGVGTGLMRFGGFGSRIIGSGLTREAIPVSADEEEDE